MITWRIPAKTFLVGEYVALQGEGAIVLTTEPCFELTLHVGEKTQGIALNSPAGRYWVDEKQSGYAFSWCDPYEEMGGLGASSAQFLAVYQAVCHMHGQQPSVENVLENYFHYAWNGQGVCPSGYDVIAQTQQGCVYINRREQLIQNYHWPFKNLSFLLLHSGVKTATHTHLQSLTTQYTKENLSHLVAQAHQAFVLGDEDQLIDAIKNYHQQLYTDNLVADHSLQQLIALQQHNKILASKGCGALGADVLLLLVAKQDKKIVRAELINAGWKILASETELFAHKD